MKLSLPVLALSAAAALATIGIAPAEAHHSFVTKTVELEGTVKSFEWTNPHSWVHLEVAGPQKHYEGMADRIASFRDAGA